MSDPGVTDRGAVQLRRITSPFPDVPRQALLNTGSKQGHHSALDLCLVGVGLGEQARLGFESVALPPVTCIAYFYSTTRLAAVSSFSSIKMAAVNEEREMTRNQRGLVDTCFEEGQYESGIAVLDQLRSSTFKPSADHVRQLLYIALFPPPPPAGDQIIAQEPPSPVKGTPMKHKPALSRSSLSPSLLESEAAQHLLFSFLVTNSPGSLLRALPRYALDNCADNGKLAESTNYGHDDDSLIARESLCIKDCRDCWSILKEGFVQRKNLLPEDTRKKRGRRVYEVDDGDLSKDRGVPALVADHAWPVLQWLISLFEKDELLHFQEFGEKFSSLLLSQIPLPRGSTGPRWDASVPLGIIFLAIAQEDGQRREMAVRLLTLLINLTLSEHFDASTFAATLTTRLYTSSSQLTQNLMESLPKTIPVLTFKITVCQKFLSSTSSTAGVSKPRPRPLPRRGPRRDSGPISSTTDIEADRPGPSFPPRTQLAAGSEVLQLLCSNHKSCTSVSAPPVLSIKYTLLMSYVHIQMLLPPGERDNDWRGPGALVDGRWKQAIDAAFPIESSYHRALTAVAGFWPMRYGHSP